MHHRLQMFDSSHFTFTWIADSSHGGHHDNQTTTLLTTQASAQPTGSSCPDTAALWDRPRHGMRRTLREDKHGLSETLWLVHGHFIALIAVDSLILYVGIRLTVR